jgi:hypothetical protein
MNCWLPVDAMHFEVVESEGINVKKTIEETPINQLNEVCMQLTIT